MHFQQSNEWARFQQALGRRVFIISPSSFVPFQLKKTLADGEGIMIERNIMGRLRYLEVDGWIPRSVEPDQMVHYLRGAGRGSGAVFVRWTLLREFPIPNSQFPNSKDITVVEPRVLTRQIPPKATLVIDLSKSEEELLKDMHEKTRYNIHLAERKGVIIQRIQHNDQDGFTNFWRLMRETAARDKIGIHPQSYYRMMLEDLAEGDVQAHIFLAEYSGEPIATAILITHIDTATYLHGGSSNVHRNLMAPHLLQWRMIQQAKQQGYHWYDFWGIAPQGENFQGHPWTGITRFKMGFGGEVREGAGTFDIIIRPHLYQLLSIVKNTRSYLTRK